MMGEHLNADMRAVATRLDAMRMIRIISERLARELILATIPAWQRKIVDSLIKQRDSKVRAISEGKE